MATPSAPHRLQLGPAKTRALPALPSGLIGIRMISPKSVFATNISPRLLKAIPFAPNGPNDGTAGCTRPQGPGAVVPFNSVLSDHILKWPSLSRRQIAPPPESDTYRLPRRSKARPFQSPGPLATALAERRQTSAPASTAPRRKRRLTVISFHPRCFSNIPRFREEGETCISRQSIARDRACIRPEFPRIHLAVKRQCK